MELKLNQPPLICYLHHAYPLTVAMENEDFNSWFLSNYIQLEYRLKSDELNFFTYVICGNSVLIPLIDYRALDLDFIFKTNIDIIDFIRNSINIGYYVTTYIDEFFISDREAYQKFHFRHEIMIYGFDSDKQIFNVIGFNHIHSYVASIVSFTELRESLLNSIDKKNDLILLKAKDEDSYHPTYNFDIENVKTLLHDYLFSINSSERFRPIGTINNFTYGISVYNELIKYYQGIIQDDNKECDFRHFSVLYEHKKTMLSRLQYLIDKKYLSFNNNYISIFSELQNISYERRNSILKYNYTKNKEIIKVTIDSLQKMSYIEKSTVENLLGDI